SEVVGSNDRALARKIEEILLDLGQTVFRDEGNGNLEFLGAAQLMLDGAQHRVLVVVGDENRIERLRGFHVFIEEAELCVSDNALGIAGHALNFALIFSTAGTSAGAHWTVSSSSGFSHRIWACSVSSGSAPCREAKNVVSSTIPKSYS